MNIKGAIFDVDGVILDSLEIWHNLGSCYLTTLGFIVDHQINQILNELSFDEGIQYLKENYKINKSSRAIKQEINALLFEFYNNEVQVKAKILSIIKYFHKQEIRMIIATAGSKESIINAFKRLDLNKYFTDIISCQDVGKGKSAPDVYNKALEVLKINKDDVVVFEDALYAIKTLKNNNYYVIGVADKNNNDQEVIKKLCDEYIEEDEDDENSINNSGK